MMKDNIIEIEQRIQAACDKSHRDRSEVTLIAVSKTKPAAMVKEAYELGMRHFGENKVQELVDKYDTFHDAYGDTIYWHQIGHLQRNKVKYLMNKSVLIHSVDSLRLAQQIESDAAKQDLVCDILIEVNIAKEDTKFGVMEEDVLPLLMDLLKLSHIRVRGLMTIAPYTEDPEKNRVYFKKLRELYIDIKTKNIDNMCKGNIIHNIGKLTVDTKENPLLDNGSTDLKKEAGTSFIEYFDTLSMGMTGDFEIAIEEGATMVRVGTGIFGERNYHVSV